MRLRVAILEDKRDRLGAMSAALYGLDDEVEICAAESAPDFIENILPQVPTYSIVSLDHDLGSAREIAGRWRDPGDGRNVAEAIARLLPSCPIIIHSTNAVGAASMRGTLSDAGWEVQSVVPYGDLEWVLEAWLPLVKRCLKR